MKKLLSFFGVFLFCLSFAQVKWLSMNEALALQEKSNKKIIIYFYNENVSATKTMFSGAFKNSVIVNQINENFYPVKFNISGNESVDFYGRKFNTKNAQNVHNFASFMSVNMAPAIIFLDNNSNPITNLMGVFSAKDLEPYLSFISSGLYQKLKSNQEWETFRTKFKSKIKE